MYTKRQRIAALIGVILLVLLYLAALVCAVFDFDGTGRLFAACLFATISIPILLWIYIGLYGKVSGKRTIADLFAPRGEPSCDPGKIPGRPENEGDEEQETGSI